jgi:hypothetical protein
MPSARTKSRMLSRPSISTLEMTTAAPGTILGLMLASGLPAPAFPMFVSVLIRSFRRPMALGLIDGPANVHRRDRRFRWATRKRATRQIDEITGYAGRR